MERGPRSKLSQKISPGKQITSSIRKLLNRPKKTIQKPKMTKKAIKEQTKRALVSVRNNLKSKIEAKTQTLLKLNADKTRILTGKSRTGKTVNQINSEIEGIKSNIKRLQNALPNATLGAEARKASDKRNANRRMAGLVLDAGNKKDHSFIPWKPVKIAGGVVEEVVDEISSKGHMATYVASWVKGRPAVKIIRTDRNGTQHPHAYYGARTNLASAPENVYMSTDPAFGNAFSSVGNTRSQIIHHSKLTGVGVSKLVSLLKSATENRYIYIDTKLIMDRYTADQAKWVNDNQKHYVVKPFSFNFAEKLSMWKETPNDELIRQMNEDITTSVPYYFKNAGVYSGDRPLCIYCVYNNVPFLWERSTGGVYTYYMSNKKSIYSLRHVLESINNIVIQAINSNFDKREVVLNIMKIVDTFHDFVGTRSSLTEKEVAVYMSNIYGNQEPYSQIINFLGKNKTNIRNLEEIFGNILMNTSISGSVRMDKGDEAFMTLLGKQGLNDYCWIYDAGTKIPIPLLQKIASTTQRATNSFFGPLGRLQPKSFDVPMTNYFTKGRTNFIPIK